MTSPAWENDRVPALIDRAIRQVARDLTEALIIERTAAGVVDEIYEANRELLEKQGWRVSQVLGSGANGTAYALDDGERVMKITLDDTEARSSHMIQGRKNERIVNIEKVFRLPKGSKDGKKAYVLIQERLYPLPDDVKTELRRAIDFIDGMVKKDVNIWVRGWDHFRRVLENVVDREDEDGSMDRGLTDALRVLKKLGVDKMMDETLRRGIRYYDYHPGNILARKDGTTVVNDLGVSQAMKDLEPPTLEGRLREAPDSTADTGAMLRNPQPGQKKPGLSKAGALTRLAQDYDELLKKNGIVPTKVIGEGSKGVAYEMSDGRVLKITTDKDEAVAAFKILRLRGAPGVVRFEKVFRFPEEEIYGIVQEKLQPLPEQADQAFRWAFVRIMRELFGSKGKGNVDRGWKNFVSRVNAEVADMDPPAPKRAQYEKAVQIYQKLGLDKIMDSLVNRGIRFHDIHPGNLMMRRPGEYVIIDLGVSDVVGGQEPPILEGFEMAVTRAIEESVTRAEVDAMRSLLTRARIRIGEYVGGGQVGHAFELMGQPEKIVKITDDVNEARSSYRVMKHGRNLRHVVRIYDVRRIPAEMVNDQPGVSSMGIRDSDAYVIIQERLSPLTPEVEKVIRNVSKIVRIFHVAIPDRRDEAERILRQRDPDRADQVLALLDSAQYFEAMGELRSIGIKFRDYHTENVMMRGNDLVVIDLGLSTVQGSSEPPDLAPRPVVRSESLIEDVSAEPMIDPDELRLVRAGLRKHGVVLDDILGSGAFGDVYSVVGKPNVVVKITSDLVEARAAHHLKTAGAGLEHVYRVYDVRRVPMPKGADGHSSLYVIVQERLEPLDESDKETFERFVEPFMGLLPRTIMDPRALKVQLSAVAGHKLAHSLAAIKKFRIPDMMRELESVGIRHADLHADNVMTRGTTYVLIDIGGDSRAPGAQSPPPIDSGALRTEGFDPTSVLEWRSLLEGPADTVAVIAASLNPFSARQADFVRRVANSVDKTVLVTWSPVNGGAAFHDLVRASLRDVERKVEVTPIPREDSLLGSLEGLVRMSPALRPGSSFELYVPAEDAAHAEEKMRSSGVFGDAPVVVRPIDAKITATDEEALSALRSGDVERAKRVMDPHLFSDPEAAEEIVSAFSAGSRMESFVRTLAGVIAEDLRSVGGEDAVRAVLGANATQLKLKKNVDVEKLRLLGSGQKGSAFLVRPGLVLKVTTDAKEAASSMNVKGKSLRHVARVHDVFRFGNTPGITDDLFGVLVEELQPLSESEASELDRALMLVRDMEDGPESDSVLEALANGRFDEMAGLLRQIWTREMGAEAGSPAAKRRVAAQVEARLAELNEALAKFKIMDMVKELLQSGVEFADFKAENMGRRDDGTIVVFDLGASRSQGVQPPVFESSTSGIDGMAGGDLPHAWSKGPTGRSERPKDEWSFEDERPSLGRLSAPV